MTESTIEPPAISSIQTKELPIWILHVDDESEFLKVARQILETNENFKVDTASSVEEAKKKLKTNKYDAVLSDYQMPGKDGLQFLKELRESDNNVPFIMFTGKGREEVAIKALNLGADYYLHKVGGPETVYGEVRNAIGKAVGIRRAEQKFRESEAKYRNLVENSKYAIALVDFKGNILFGNRAAEQLTGYSLEEGVGMNIKNITPKRLWPKSLTMILKARMGKPISYWKSEIIRKDGTKVYVETGGQAFRKDGKLVGIQIITRDITEQKKAGEALKDSEEKYRTIVESASDAIFEFNEDGELLSANQQAAKILGMKPKSLVGKSMHDLFPTDIAERQLSDLKETFQSGRSILNKESQIKTNSGLRWVNTSLIPIKDGNGKIVKVLGFSRDITERKIVEQELKKSAIYLDMMGDALMVLSPDAKLVKVNKAFSEIWGYSPEEIVGTPVFKLFTEEEIPKHRKEMEIAAKTGRKRIFETIALTKNGNKIPVSVNGILIRDTNGKPLNFIASFRDITKRKQTEEKLSQSEKKYRNIVELSPDGLAVLNMKGFVTSINPAFSKLTGFSKEEIVGKHFTKLGTLRMRDLPIYLNLFRSVIRGRLPDTHEFTYVRKDGSVRSGDARYTFLVENGRRVGVQVVLRDITERKKAEESVSKTLAKLKELNEKLEVVGSLTRHDIRNKLMIIQGRVFLVNKKLGGNIDAQEDLVEVQRAIKEAERILNFAKEYESLGKEELAFVSVSDNIKSAVSLLPMAGADLEGVKIVEQCDGIRVFADSMLQQLFYNLIDNSMKHGENLNQIKVYYKAGKNDLKLIYEDNGVGVSKAEKEKIFEKGYGKGTGYGLYLIKKMCEVYGWTIMETGKQGKGAQFTMSIPKLNEQKNQNYKLD